MLISIKTTYNVLKIFTSCTCLVKLVRFFFRNVYVKLASKQNKHTNSPSLHIMAHNHFDLLHFNWFINGGSLNWADFNLSHLFGQLRLIVPQNPAGLDKFCAIIKDSLKILTL